MATLNFLKGLKADLPLLRQPDNFYITTDEGAIYLDNHKWTSDSSGASSPNIWILFYKNGDLHPTPEVGDVSTLDKNDWDLYDYGDYQTILSDWSVVKVGDIISLIDTKLYKREWVANVGVQANNTTSLDVKFVESTQAFAHKAIGDSIETSTLIQSIPSSYPYGIYTTPIKYGDDILLPIYGGVYSGNAVFYGIAPDGTLKTYPTNLNEANDIIFMDFDGSNITLLQQGYIWYGQDLNNLVKTPTSDVQYSTSIYKDGTQYVYANVVSNKLVISTSDTLLTNLQQVAVYDSETISESNTTIEKIGNYFYVGTSSGLFRIDLTTGTIEKTIQDNSNVSFYTYKPFKANVGNTEYMFVSNNTSGGTSVSTDGLNFTVASGFGNFQALGYIPNGEFFYGYKNGYLCFAHVDSNLNVNIKSTNIYISNSSYSNIALGNTILSYYYGTLYKNVLDVQRELDFSDLPNTDKIIAFKNNAFYELPVAYDTDFKDTNIASVGVIDKKILNKSDLIYVKPQEPSLIKQFNPSSAIYPRTSSQGGVYWVNNAGSGTSAYSSDGLTFQNLNTTINSANYSTYGGICMTVSLTGTDDWQITTNAVYRVQGLNVTTFSAATVGLNNVGTKFAPSDGYVYITNNTGAAVRTNDGSTFSALPAAITITNIDYNSLANKYVYTKANGKDIYLTDDINVSEGNLLYSNANNIRFIKYVSVLENDHIIFIDNMGVWKLPLTNELPTLIFSIVNNFTTWGQWNGYIVLWNGVDILLTKNFVNLKTFKLSPLESGGYGSGVTKIGNQLVWYSSYGTSGGGLKIYSLGKFPVLTNFSDAVNDPSKGIVGIDSATGEWESIGLPTIPSADGSYKLVISGGVATWETI
ncbi:hypothetical protein [Dysgonomonas termitidis]|uniref:Uncharacterized protein n=1 Tax=Dysgonomonas termitidis TaxID=1516126 RepID=A0ABV9KWI1_9BACT